MADWYLDSNTGSDANDGSDWNNARIGLVSTYALMANNDNMLIRGEFTETFSASNTNRSFSIYGIGEPAILNNRLSKSEGGTGRSLKLKNIVLNGLFDVNNIALTLGNCVLNGIFSPILAGNDFNANGCSFAELGLDDAFREISGSIIGNTIVNMPIRSTKTTSVISKLTIKNNYITGNVSLSKAAYFKNSGSFFKHNYFAPTAQIRFATDLSTYGAYSNIVSDAQVNAKFLSEVGLGDIFFDNIVSTIAVDAFNFPIGEDAYILNQHIGANRYANATLDPKPSLPTGWDGVLGDYFYLHTTSDTPDPITFISSIPQARKARRLVFEFERVNNIEQFGTDGRIAVKIQLSFDGGLTYPLAEFTRYVGIQSGTLDFDFIDFPATDFKLTFESQGIAGGAGGVRFRYVGVEFYDMDEQITAGARTLYEQKATDPAGYFVVGLPYKVETTLGDFTAQEIKDNPAANKSFSDGNEDNMIGFALSGEIYETFIAEPVEITNVRAIKAGINGSDIEIKNVPCSNFNHKMLKFKNGAGAWEYLLFYARDEEKPSRSSEQYLQFEDGYKNVNGDIQRDYKLYNDEIDIINKPVLDYLDKNQNAWYANGWQFSSFTTILMPSTAENFPLLTNERLLKTDLTQAQYNEVYERFKTGDRVTFVTSDYLINMYGFISQMSESNGAYTVYFKFTGATGNNDLASLDAILGGTDVYIVAYDAWELCTVDNLTVTTTSRSVLNVSLTLKTNPETNYRV